MLGYVIYVRISSFASLAKCMILQEELTPWLSVVETNPQSLLSFFFKFVIACKSTLRSTF